MTACLLVGSAPLRASVIKRVKLWVKSRHAVVVGAIDGGGVEGCRRLGLKPFFALGDWDSGQPPRQCPFLWKLNPDKDRSDLWYGLQLASQWDDVALCGVSGGREDHALAALGDLALFGYGSAFLDHSMVHAVSEGSRFFLDPWVKKTFSVFSLLGAAKVRFSGCRYTFDGPLRCSSRGLSNETVHAGAFVEVVSGSVLVFTV